jgi:hypothetical protein
MHNTSKALSTVCLLHMQYQKKMGQGMCVFFLVMLQVRQKYFTSSFFMSELSKKLGVIIFHEVCLTHL